MTSRILRRILAGAAALALVTGSSGAARATFYAYAFQRTSGYTFSGATVGTINPLSGSSAAQVGSVTGGESHTGSLDVLQSYVGPARPAENTFTPLGQVNPDYARGDALLTTGAATPFSTNNVAEAYLIGPGTSAGSGSWAVSAPITLTATGAVTLAFAYINQLTLINTSSPVPGVVSADFGYTFSIQDSTGASVFTSSPTAVNRGISLFAPGSTSLPGSGTVTITSGSLAAGTYTATISGSEHTFINSVPEPTALALTAVGVGLLTGVWARRRLPRDQG